MVEMSVYLRHRDSVLHFRESLRKKSSADIFNCIFSFDILKYVLLEADKAFFTQNVLKKSFSFSRKVYSISFTLIMSNSKLTPSFANYFLFIKFCFLNNVLTLSICFCEVCFECECVLDITPSGNLLTFRSLKYREVL